MMNLAGKFPRKSQEECGELKKEKPGTVLGAKSGWMRVLMTRLCFQVQVLVTTRALC